MDDASAVFPAADPLGDRRHQPHPVPGLHRATSCYQRELERFFYRSHWCYVGLEAEIPNAGDFKRTVVGERSVIMVRDTDGAINVVENVCAHRGMRFCRERHGNRKDFTCPYHQWNYTLQGRPAGRAVPPRRQAGRQGQRRHAGRLQDQPSTASPS